MATPVENPIGERIASLETGVATMTSAVEKLTDRIEQLPQNLADQVTKEVGHAKANIMQVVDTKAPKDLTDHRLKALESDMKLKAPNESFKEVRSWVIGAAVFVLVAFGTAVTGMVFVSHKTPHQPVAHATTVVQPR